ncbi:MAG: hypothetical protein QGG64_28335 [Candidatus Latescibacteria bacterium]|jgi:hypothetical protein|nr:hypothetical protein [Candidatus Latescibacterota bacterium]
MVKSEHKAVSPKLKEMYHWVEQYCAISNREPPHIFSYTKLDSFGICIGFEFNNSETWTKSLVPIIQKRYPEIHWGGLDSPPNHRLFQVEEVFAKVPALEIRFV